MSFTYFSNSIIRLISIEILHFCNRSVHIHTFPAGCTTTAFHPVAVPLESVEANCIVGSTMAETADKEKKKRASKKEFNPQIIQQRSSQTIGIRPPHLNWNEVCVPFLRATLSLIQCSLSHISVCHCSSHTLNIWKCGNCFLAYQIVFFAKKETRALN